MKALAYREAEPSDLRFIEKSYLDSFRFSHSAGTTSVESWDEEERPRWRRILQRPNVRCVVAYKPGESPETRADLYGYLVYETGYVDRKTKQELPYVVFLYIKANHRRRIYDIQSGLFEAAGIDPTKRFHYGIKTPAITRNPIFKSDSHRPLFVRFPPPKTNPERQDP